MMRPMDDAKPNRRVRRVPRRGMDVLHDPLYNKGTGFTEAERDALRIRGLVPPGRFTQDEQLRRILENYEAKTSDLERYIYLNALQDRNERLFFRTVIDNIEEMMPIIYTPTVGEASRQFAHIFRRPRGLYVSAADRGRVVDVLRNWPRGEVRVIVVTDGERILGLGDLGASGMGIPVGKLALYTACAGIDPAVCLPVMLDVGTDKESMRVDPLYLGLRQKRLRGSDYTELVEEFVMGVQEVFPGALIQFEDFLTPNAYALLREYRDRVLCFNDDIQGTAAVVLAGLKAATRITKRPLETETVLFLGAGSAATGIADLIVSSLVGDGVPVDEARSRLWFVDVHGLVVKSRDDLQPHNLPYAHEHAPLDFPGALEALKPATLIGATGAPGTFSRDILETMASLHERPIVFALSNPTSKAECTAGQAYEATGGRAVFASGSPFAPVELEGETYVPGQGNNAYVFPGIGLGVVASGATRVTDEMFLAAAFALADSVSEASLRRGTVYPPLTSIREVSVLIATAVAKVAYEQELATVPRPADLEAHVRETVWEPYYESYA